MKRLWSLILASELSVLTRLACLCAGISLLFMVVIVLVKIPLILVLGVGVAHGFGILGVVLFAIAVLKESFSPHPGSPPTDASRTSQTPHSET